MSSKLKIGLAASLALNLFVLGAAAGVAGSALNDRKGPRPQPSGNSIVRAGDNLPEEVREAFRERMSAQGEQSRPLFQAAREARQEAATLLASGDSAGADAALKRARDAELEARTRIETSMVQFAATLPPEQRAEFAQNLRRGGMGRPGFGRRGDGRRGPDGPPPPPPGAPAP